MYPELSILKLFLTYSVWETYRNRLSIKDIPKDLQPVYSILDNYHNTNEGKADLSVADLANLIGAESFKDKDYYLGILEQIEKVDASVDTTIKLITRILANKHLNDISLAAHEAKEGRRPLEDVTFLFKQLEELEQKEEEIEENIFASDDLEYLINNAVKKPGLRWRLKTLNEMLGSLRKGDFGFVFARPECISGETLVRIKFNPESQSSIQLKLSDFYKRFNGNHHLKGEGPYQIQATSPEGNVYYTNIEHVSFSSKKKVYRIQTERGFSVKASADHKFLLADGKYRRLDQLIIGDNLRTDRTSRQPRLARTEYSGTWPGAPYSNGRAADPDKIVDISYVGEEDCYDIGVAGPNKNFRAGGIYVHNCGKTTFLASEITHMVTQLDDVAGPILWINNEEQSDKVMLRCIQASTGCTLPQLYSDIASYKKLFKENTRGKLKIIKDLSVISRRDVEGWCKKYKPSLIIFDQIDKIVGFDSDREDLKLGAIYQWARELAKQYAPVIAVCQADGTGEGVKWLTMNNVANAKTSKQAEADWILGIGKINDIGYDSVRYLHLSKNKLMGDEDTVPDQRHGRREVIIKPEVARYGDI